MFILQTNLLQRHKNELQQCSQTVNTHSQGILLEKKRQKKEKAKERKGILLSCIYESICLNIEKKNYMLTNL